MGSTLSIDQLSVSFGSVRAVRDVSLSVKPGEFVSLLGPSGCGKSTLLRAIAGYQNVDRGSITLAEKEITNSPPQVRHIGMVFQNYALFPHMTVFENIAFGLRQQRRNHADIQRKVNEMVAMVQLGGLEQRKPGQLSGGQQQRAALARALACEPKLLLLDEPLGALDLRLREAMQIEIKRVQRATGVTTIFVTHDQGEALAMSDRIVVMNEGCVEQIGVPHDIYENPETTFVAEFVGKSNILHAVIKSLDDESIHVVLDGSTATIPIKRNPRLALRAAETCSITIRPEHVHLTQIGNESAQLTGIIDEVEYLGTHRLLVVQSRTGQKLLAYHNDECHRGQRVELYFNPDKIRVLV